MPPKGRRVLSPSSSATSSASESSDPLHTYSTDSLLPQLEDLPSSDQLDPLPPLSIQSSSSRQHEVDRSSDYAKEYFPTSKFKIKTRSGHVRQFSSISTDTPTEDTEAGAWTRYKRFKQIDKPKHLPRNFKFLEAARKDPELRHLAVQTWDKGLHRVAKYFRFEVSPPPPEVVPQPKRKNRWGVWYYCQLLSQIRSGEASPLYLTRSYVTNGIVYDTPKQRQVWAAKGIDWPTDAEGVVPFEDFNKLGAAPADPTRSPSPKPAVYRAGLRDITSLTYFAPTTSREVHDMADPCSQPEGTITKARFEPGRLPDTGWGMNSEFTDKIGQMEPWDIFYDLHEKLQGASEEELKAFEDNPQKLPQGLAFYGLWNVSPEQILDPTWTPPPYTVLDDACMLIVMCLSDVDGQRGQYWPFNFDSAGYPRATRLRFGPGIYCHWGTLTADGKKFQNERTTYLVWRRHHIFGGEEISNTTSGEDRAKIERMVHAAKDPSQWGHGISQLGPDDKTADDGKGNSLHLYIAHNRLGSQPSDPASFRTNRSGPWFDKMHRHLTQVPYMLDDTLRAKDTRHILNPAKTTKISDSEHSGVSSSLRPQDTIAAESGRGRGTSTSLRGGRGAGTGRGGSVPPRPTTPASSLSASVGSASSPFLENPATRIPVQRSQPLRFSVMPIQPETTGSQAQQMEHFSQQSLTPSYRISTSSQTDAGPSIESLGKRSAEGIFEEHRYIKRPKTDQATRPRFLASKEPDDKPMDKLREENEALLAWFNDFDDTHPQTANSDGFQELLARPILASWTKPASGLNTVQEEQKVMALNLERRIKEIKSCTKQLSNQMTTLTQTQTMLRNQLHSLSRELEIQPVYSHMRAVKDGMTELLEIGSVETARWVGTTVQHRLDNETGYFFDFDANRDVPGAEAWCEVIFDKPTLPTEAKPANSKIQGLKPVPVPVPAPGPASALASAPVLKTEPLGTKDRTVKTADSIPDLIL